MFEVHGFLKSTDPIQDPDGLRYQELHSNKLSVTSQQKAVIHRRTKPQGQGYAIFKKEDPCRSQLHLFCGYSIPSIFSWYGSEGAKPSPFPSFRNGHVTQDHPINCGPIHCSGGSLGIVMWFRAIKLSSEIFIRTNRKNKFRPWLQWENVSLGQRSANVSC